MAASLNAQNGIRVFDVGRGYHPLPSETQYGASSYWVDFDRSGRLVTTSYDGFVRIYAAEHDDKPREHICGSNFTGPPRAAPRAAAARERAPRPHEVFGAVQATSDRLDILINNAGIGTASPRQTCR